MLICYSKTFLIIINVDSLMNRKFKASALFQIEIFYNIMNVFTVAYNNSIQYIFTK